ncbi:MAG: hypothetical protein CL581_16795 [Alteromonadaceae bacterium]|uniref:hypothetical protein n=1 Tax=Marinobacter sp. BGYM27 TaxID=2975597 RepID=UPI000C4FF097|nr:hypothetical protein [Marinobacter sp. BGYM27]MAA66416.1 hypothetical protein [Alteromonadaceae bacterium]MBH85273.1 hypothetical protein [Alteromonadaceae bacterium]MDG5499820.1 hypothetical protein [Marinobacter sp. BGYM27]|tara:strand:+ start:786 stop:1178 length:393 start_codon:yes stop_codon:yes gene_type:complete
MMTLAAERSWLLDRGLLKLVHQCRRLILAEFGIKVHLTDEHLQSQLAAYAKKSRSPQLSNVWEELREKLQNNGETQEPQTTVPRKMYRGQPVESNEPGHAGIHDERGQEDSASGRTRTITYRGQTIEVPV